MKNISLLTALIIGMMPLCAHADDFGARFSDQAPSALADDPSDDFAGDFDPSKIEPAAGDPSGDAFSPQSIENAPSGKTPEELISEIEKIMSEIETNLDENAQ